MEKSTILVVDNNAVIRRLLTHILEKMGYLVTTADDGLSALEILATFHPDVIFTDLIMPNIDGRKLCRIIRKRDDLKDIFLVVLSAVAAEQQIDFAGFGADACIAKGPAREMEKHIITVMSSLERPGSQLEPDEILGVGNVFERAITGELLAIKEHFELTLENLDDGFLELTDKGTVIYANDAAIRLFHIFSTNFLGTLLFDYFSGSQQERIMAAFSNLTDSPVTIGESNSFSLFDRFLLIKFIPAREKGKKIVFVLFNDITSRKIAEQELDNRMLELEVLVKQRTAKYKKANQELLQEIEERRKIQHQLQHALEEVNQLSGMLPICASCKKIRDDKGYWNQIESYIRDHSEAEFSHGICPECVRKLYPDLDIDLAE